MPGRRIRWSLAALSAASIACLCWNYSSFHDLHNISFSLNSEFFAPFSDADDFDTFDQSPLAVSNTTSSAPDNSAANATLGVR
jgi:hypothetical protein